MNARAWAARLAGCLLAACLGACGTLQPYPPGYADCYARVQKHATDLIPAFAALGYRPSVQIYLDEKLPDVYGLHAMSDVMGDALPNGRIRLRISSVCGNDMLARAVVAHEIAHVALQHRGVPPTGLVLAWEGPPPQEREADRLGLAALRQAGGYPAAQAYLECRTGECGVPGGAMGNPSFRGVPRKAAP
ncbi:MAG TPA: hypothetical protein VF801_13855 [Rhodocyclaceae bacterium]